MNLIVCCTMYQLINAVNLKVSNLCQGDTDLLLVNSTDFSLVKEKLKEVGLYRDIFEMPNYLPMERTFRDKLSEKERLKISKDPCLFMDYSVIKRSYDNLYLAIDDVYGKLLYYYLLSNNHNLRIHLYEDGLSSYTKNYEARFRSDQLHHQYYSTNSFEKNITAYYLYSPSLYCGSKWKFPISELPKITKDSKNLISVLKDIFLTNEMEKISLQYNYLYLVEAFIDKKIVVEDTRLLNFVSDVLGKENIAVKLHPREHIDRFTPRGYHVLGNYTLPWEIILLANIEKRVSLFSFSSTACLTGKLVFDMDSYSVFACKMPLINANYVLRDKTMAKFLSLVDREFNRNGRFFFCPNSFSELKEILLYLRGMLHESN